MPRLVCSTATIKCTFGVAPATLTAIPAGEPVTIHDLPAATIMDYKPMANIAPFGMCITPTNPQVAAATAAALGTLTPQPCIPVTTGPWTPGAPDILINGSPALNETSLCMCAWAGAISVVDPAQNDVISS